MQDWVANVILIAVTIVLVLLNGFFVASEFALVKLRRGRLEELVREGRLFSPTAKWLMDRLDRALSACQLGITMASLGLGWIGEPAIARLLEPAFHAIGITSAAVLHTISFIIAFTIITAAHLTIGEQAPKIFAIRRPESIALWCAVPLRWFYIVSYPLLMGLNSVTSLLLRTVGVHGAGEHDAPHSEEEIRALLSHSHAHGELTQSEARLLEAVFEFDETACRQVMVPRIDVQFFDVNKSLAEAIRTARTSAHTRFPLCDGSLDHVLGVIHTKDLIGVTEQDGIELREIARPPHYVPETAPIRRLLAQFKASRQHLAFVIDEYGSVDGIVTLENVLERLVGSVQDEFDAEAPMVVPDGPGRFLVPGGAAISEVNRRLDLHLASREVETVGGLIMERLGRVATPGDRVSLDDGVEAEVLEAAGARIERVRLVLPRPAAT
jgi:CBS domain containing-hemolysin-like protein